jgi:hypothetical protein
MLQVCRILLVDLITKLGEENNLRSPKPMENIRAKMKVLYKNGQILQYSSIVSSLNRYEVASWRRACYAAGVGNDVVVCRKLPERAGLSIQFPQLRNVAYSTQKDTALRLEYPWLFWATQSFKSTIFSP